jgi:glutaredoxin
MPAARAVLIILMMSTAEAGIYKWTDEQGNVHFGDRPPAAQVSQPIEVKINSYESVTTEPFKAFKRQRPTQANTVIMYSTTWCGVCKRAKRYFQANKIPYQEYDVENTRKGREDYKRLKGRGVPIILVGNKRMNGFSAARFSALYQAGQ